MEEINQIKSDAISNIPLEVQIEEINLEQVVEENRD